MKSLLELAMFVFIVLVIWGLWKPNDNPVHKAKVETDRMKANVGGKVVYQKDTLMIVDYSFWADTYKLSNGVDINKSLLPTIQIKK